MWIYDNIVWWWAWADLFISLIMFVFWFLFFPFSFAWQKQLFWASFNTLGLFTIIMFFVFTGITFSVLQEIFQWDFMFTIWSILAVILVLFWWAILIPKSSLLLTKHLWIRFSMLRNQWIFIVFIVVFSVDIIWISHSSSSIDYNGTTSVCLWSELKLHSDDRIDVYITSAWVDAPQEWRVDKSSFSIGEFEGLSYYIEWEAYKEQYYFNREICNLDTQNPNMSIMYDWGMPVEEMYPGADSWFSSNISQFDNRDFVAWNYALNVFVSDDDKNWSLAKVLNFEVK